jgi:hypothetical protein
MERRVKRVLSQNDIREIVMDSESDEDNYAFYNPSEHLSIDEVIVKFKGRVVFKQYIPKKRKRFGIKMFKLCDSTRNTYDMKFYLGNDRQRAEHHLTATHATVTYLTIG